MHEFENHKKLISSSQGWMHVSYCVIASAATSLHFNDGLQSNDVFVFFQQVEMN